jgi:hypothetical protein
MMHHLREHGEAGALYCTRVPARTPAADCTSPRRTRTAVCERAEGCVARHHVGRPLVCVSRCRSAPPSCLAANFGIVRHAVVRAHLAALDEEHDSGRRYGLEIEATRKSRIVLQRASASGRWRPKTPGRASSRATDAQPGGAPALVGQRAADRGAAKSAVSKSGTALLCGRS